jgi:hypothetical protein
LARALSSGVKRKPHSNTDTGGEFQVVDFAA